MIDCLLLCYILAYIHREREWHSELRDATFGHVLLQALENFLSSIKTSWLEGISVKMIAILTHRLLASAPDPTIVSKACNLLLKARQVTFRWVKQLVERSHEAEDEVTVQEFQHHICEMAAICQATFDPDHLPLLLFSMEHIEILVSCAILIYDSSSLIKMNMPLCLVSILDDHQ